MLAIVLAGLVALLVRRFAPGSGQVLKLDIGGVTIDSFWIGSVLVIVLTGLYTTLGGTFGITQRFNRLELTAKGCRPFAHPEQPIAAAVSATSNSSQ